MECVGPLQNLLYLLTDCFHVLSPLQLWNLMMPDTPLEERITKQWGDLGFQGKDPQTDFRGMGML